jgi:hypothetical protein
MKYRMIEIETDLHAAPLRITRVFEFQSTYSYTQPNPASPGRYQRPEVSPARPRGRPLNIARHHDVVHRDLVFVVVTTPQIHEVGQANFVVLRSQPRAVLQAVKVPVFGIEPGGAVDGIVVGRLFRSVLAAPEEAREAPAKERTQCRETGAENSDTGLDT